jgi:phosphopantothenoylcysteine decarboxylase/phosphopantothenate--cysteine ligase
MKKKSEKRILLIITGSIAAYKSLDLIRLLKKFDYQVNVVMTKAAKEFITPLLVSSISGSQVYQDLFSLSEENEMGHINLSRKNDLIVVAPASADIIAKMSVGTGDDLASTTLLASNKPVFVAPAMNEKMWLSSSNQKNIILLRERGVKILDPKTDILACGEFGVGKMVDVEEIFAKVDAFFNEKKLLNGKKIVVTAGATFEAIDPVRFIGNYSSGKQGIAIGERLADLGADVIFIAANIEQNINLNSKSIVRVKSADEMMTAVNEAIIDADAFIGAAAVADFKPKNYSSGKIKKDKKSFNSIDLVENIDILKTVGSLDKRPKIVIGFAAESDDLIKNASKKLTEKNCDLIVANDIKNGQVFGSNYNQVSILSKNKPKEDFKEMTKVQIANILVARLAELL